MRSRKVHLKNGTNSIAYLVKTVMLTLEDLQKKNNDVFQELVSLVQNPEYEISDKATEALKQVGILMPDESLPMDIYDVIASALETTGEGVKLVWPVASEEQ